MPASILWNEDSPRPNTKAIGTVSVSVGRRINREDDGVGASLLGTVKEVLGRRIIILVQVELNGSTVSFESRLETNDA